MPGVRRLCFESKELPLGDTKAMPFGRQYYVATLVEVNPLSQATLDLIKQWVTRPKGSTSIGPGDSLFGSFVGLFVRQIGSADRTLRFRTQSIAP